MKSNIIGVYNSQDDVINAIQDLQNDGYSVKELGIIGRTKEMDSNVENETGANSLTFASGSNDDGLIDNLSNLYNDNNENQATENKFMELGMTKDEAREYVSFVEEGKIILFNENKGTNMINKETNRNENPNAARAGYNFESEPRTGMRVSGEYDSLTRNNQHWQGNENQSMKLREEELDINKKQVQAGEVTVHKDIVEEQETINVPVSHEEVFVERRKVDGDRMEASGPLGDNETIRIPIHEEKIDVNKKSIVTDEVVIGKREVQETEKVTENLKKEEVRLENNGSMISEKRTDRTDGYQNHSNNNKPLR